MSGDLFAYPTPRDCSGQKVSALYLSARSREFPVATVRGSTFRTDAGIRQTHAPNSEVGFFVGVVKRIARLSRDLVPDALLVQKSYRGNWTAERMNSNYRFRKG